MHGDSMSLAVIIHGRNGAHQAREYVSPVDRETYVEGREGSEFTLRIFNGSRRRVLMVPSVDGLSVLDGKPAGSRSPGFVVGPGGSVDVPGWMVDRSTAARFFFAGSSSGDESYVAKMGGDVANKGVIGLMVFAENHVTLDDVDLFRRRRLRGSMLSARPSAASLSCSDSSPGVLRASSASASFEPVEQSLGAGFGDATLFTTREASFDRGALIVSMVVRYDDARGLKRRGIDVSRPVAAKPNAFPADAVGCRPPHGWGS